MNNDINRLINSLGRSKFRGSFHLNTKMKQYVKDKGIDKIQKDTYEIIQKRLKDSYIANDGKQTPMKQVHPTFIAQHATATCCRNCLEKVHHIKKGYTLKEEEIDYIVLVIMSWIKNEMEKKD